MARDHWNIIRSSDLKLKSDDFPDKFLKKAIVGLMGKHLHNISDNIEMAQEIVREANRLKNIKEISQEERALSDKLEELLGRDTYIEIFFSPVEASRIKSAFRMFERIKDSKEPKVVKAKTIINPQIAYDNCKYKKRFKNFTKQGVEKLLNSSEITKAQKKFLVFNLDQAEDGNEINVNFKEWIYHKIIDEVGSTDE